MRRYKTPMHYELYNCWDEAEGQGSGTQGNLRPIDDRKRSSQSQGTDYASLSSDALTPPITTIRGPEGFSAASRQTDRRLRKSRVFRDRRDRI